MFANDENLEDEDKFCAFCRAHNYLNELMREQFGWDLAMLREQQQAPATHEQIIRDYLDAWFQEFTAKIQAMDGVVPEKPVRSCESMTSLQHFSTNVLTNTKGSNGSISSF